MNKIVKLLLALLGGLLSWLAWPTSPLFFLIFFAWVPILLVEDYYHHNYDGPKKLRLFPYVYAFFLSWNVMCSWWLWYATKGGSVAANFTNAFLMCIPFMLFHQARKKFGDSIGYASLVIFWLTFELLHMNWELSWSWFNLGNVFAMFPQIVQWYEFTGVAGGTIWILVFNIVILKSVKELAANPPKIDGFASMISNFVKLISKPTLLLLIPIVVSLIIFGLYEEKGEKTEIVVLQPNVDPYNKFKEGSREFYMSKFIEMTRSGLTENTSYSLWPETSIPHYIHLNRIEEYKSVKQIREMIKDYPNLQFVSGASTIKNFKEGEKITNTARQFTKTKKYYDAYNSAIQLDSDPDYQLYIKSKLVPGSERMPYPHLMKFLEKFMVDLGGIGGSLATQKGREVFEGDNDIAIAPVVCYESIYGGYVTEYIRKGANLIFIVTNDAWWENTKGHKHHLHYASLRAIENRRSIARSANTGISCFIDQRGLIHQRTIYGEEAVIRGEILANDHLTFYSRYGDIIYRIAFFLAIFLFMNLLVSKFTNDFKLIGNKRK